MKYFLYITFYMNVRFTFIFIFTCMCHFGLVLLVQQHVSA